MLTFFKTTERNMIQTQEDSVNNIIALYTAQMDTLSPTQKQYITVYNERYLRAIITVNHQQKTMLSNFFDLNEKIAKTQGLIDTYKLTKELLVEIISTIF